LNGVGIRRAGTRHATARDSKNFDAALFRDGSSLRSAIAKAQKKIHPARQAKLMFDFWRARNAVGFRLHPGNGSR